MNHAVNHADVGRVVREGSFCSRLSKRSTLATLHGHDVTDACFLLFNGWSIKIGTEDVTAFDFILPAVLTHGAPISLHFETELVSHHERVIFKTK